MSQSFVWLGDANQLGALGMEQIIEICPDVIVGQAERDNADAIVDHSRLPPCSRARRISRAPFYPTCRSTRPAGILGPRAWASHAPGGTVDLRSRRGCHWSRCLGVQHRLSPEEA